MPFVTEGSLEAQENLVDRFLAGEKRIKELEGAGMLYLTYHGRQGICPPGALHDRSR